MGIRLGYKASTPQPFRHFLTSHNEEQEGRDGLTLCRRQLRLTNCCWFLVLKSAHQSLPAEDANVCPFDVMLAQYRRETENCEAQGKSPQIITVGVQTL